MRPVFKYWLPVFLWMVFIFAISSLTDKDIPQTFFGADFLFHISEYLLLTLLLNRALRNSSPFISWDKRRRIFVAVLFCFIYAVSDEFHQQFVPGRVSSAIDLIFDGVGILIGNVIYRW